MLRSDGLAAMHNAARLECIATEMKIQDKTLNLNYRVATEKMDAEQKSRAVTAQRAWIQYRDTDCALETSVNPSPVTRPLCLLTKTTARSLELRDLTELLK